MKNGPLVPWALRWTLARTLPQTLTLCAHEHFSRLFFILLQHVDYDVYFSKYVDLSAPEALETMKDRKIACKKRARPYDMLIVMQSLFQVTTCLDTTNGCQENRKID